MCIYIYIHIYIYITCYAIVRYNCCGAKSAEDRQASGDPGRLETRVKEYVYTCVYIYIYVYTYM